MKLKLTDLILEQSINPKIIDSYKEWVTAYNNNDPKKEKLLYYLKYKINKRYSSQPDRQKVMQYLHKNVAPNPLAKGWKSYSSWLET